MTLFHPHQPKRTTKGDTSQFLLSFLSVFFFKKFGFNLCWEILHVWFFKLIMKNQFKLIKNINGILLFFKLTISFCFDFSNLRSFCTIISNGYLSLIVTLFENKNTLSQYNYLHLYRYHQWLAKKLAYTVMKKKVYFVCLKIGSSTDSLEMNIHDEQCPKRNKNKILSIKSLCWY